MPVYQYACTECGEQLEVRQTFTDDALTVCPVCEGRLRKVLSAVGVVFKGSGFYRTDSRAASTSSNGSDASGGSSTESSSGSKESSGPKESSGTKASGSNGSGSNNGSSSTSSTSSSSKAPASS